MSVFRIRFYRDIATAAGKPDRYHDRTFQSLEAAEVEARNKGPEIFRRLGWSTDDAGYVIMVDGHEKSMGPLLRSANEASAG